MNFAKTVSEEMKEASHQKIQIYPVKPIVDSNNEDDVRHFEHSRSFKKDESETESKNSIEQRWVERRIFTTTDSFPSISTSNRIVNVKSIILRPVSSGLHGRGHGRSVHGQSMVDFRLTQEFRLKSHAIVFWRKIKPYEK